MCEIGAHTCIDRAALGVTHIGDGVKLDNQVHIAHNCHIGNNVVIAAQTGLSGGIVVEDDAVIGGKVGIGDKARSSVVRCSAPAAACSHRKLCAVDRSSGARRRDRSKSTSSNSRYVEASRGSQATARYCQATSGVGEPLMLVVVGGHTRNIGKTSVICSDHSLDPIPRWTAIKITQYGHGVCSKDGEACECALPDHPFALQQEQNATTGTDTSRFLAAGASKSYWARTATGNLGEALPALRRLWGSSDNTIVESNSILQFVKPDLYLTVLDFAIADFKDSSLRYLDRADAVIAVSSQPPSGRALHNRSGAINRYLRSRTAGLSRIAAGLPRLVADLSIGAVIGRFLGDDHVVHVAFAQPRGRDRA